MVAASDFLPGTRPCTFFLATSRLLPGGIWVGFSDLSPSALLRLFPCASIRVVRRSDQGYFAGPSPPPHGDPGAVATFSSLSSNLPGAGPRPNSAGRTSPATLCGRQSQEAL